MVLKMQLNEKIPVLNAIAKSIAANMVTRVVSMEKPPFGERCVCRYIIFYSAV